MTAADPETYLRLAYEEAVMGPGRGRDGLVDATAVGDNLRDVGVLPRATCDTIRQLYLDALSAQGDHFVAHLHRRAAEPEDLAVVHAIDLDRELRIAGRNVRLRSIRLGPGRSELELTDHDPGSGRRPHRGGFPALTQVAFTVADDHGTVVPSQRAQWSSSNGSWTGTYFFEGLDPTTRRLVIDGTPLDLPAAPDPPAVTYETVEAGDPLEDILIDRLLTGLGNRHNGNRLEQAIHDLEAVGVLAGDDPRSVGIRRASDALNGGGDRRGLAEPWASVTARLGRTDGPTFTTPVGAVVRLGDCCVRIDRLDSDPETFWLKVLASPAGAIGSNAFMGTTDTTIQWWAEDDRGGRYLLTPGDSGGGSDRLMTGTLESLTPLDPEATELRLTPTAAGTRAQLTLNMTPPPCS